MRRNLATRFWHDEGAAIAPLYALALFGLIGIAGVGMDYGRMMAMDSELQNAADQAALAAATQLDGGADAMSRAQAAAEDYLANADSDWVNETRNSNDGDGRPITDLTFRFYAGYDTATDEFDGDPLGTGEDSDAKVVEVIVNGREVFFALTPVVDAISSGDIRAEAVAGLETATCNVPPMMFCVPTGETSFPTTADIGRGIVMHVPAQGEGWNPGNFGFLNIDYPNVDPNDQNHTTGLNSDFLGCAGDSVESRTGQRTPEMNSLNTRFDMYANPLSCDTGNGDFCPAQNVRKDYTITETVTVRGTDPGAVPSCGDNRATLGNWTANAAANNFKKDACYYSGTCSSYGNGTWDYTTYMAANHPSVSYSASTFGRDSLADLTRYDVYEWELGDSSRMAAQTLSSTGWVKQGNQNAAPNPNTRWTNVNVCTRPQPVASNAVVPSDTQKDRRILTVAAVDCTGLNGSEEVNVLRWVDLFLVQPSDASSSDQSFYAEVIGEADPPGANQASFQYYGRNKPVLLR